MPLSKPVERRARLLVFNQYYAPGVEATAHLLTELCEELARDYDVTTITGRLRDHEDEPDYEIRNGVEIIRVHSTAYDRAPLHRRAVNYFTYLGRALRRGLQANRPDIVLCMTDPPLVGDVALIAARRFRAPLVVISQDVFPEIAVQLRRLTNPLLIRILDVLTRFYLHRAERVVAIGQTMERRLEAKGVDPGRVRVIPNWTDPAAIAPAPRENEWAREQALVGRFVVMHSGNVGHAQDLETLIRAAAELRDLERLAVVCSWASARGTPTTSRSPTGSRWTPSASFPISLANASRSHSPAPMFTSSGSRAASRATSSRAASTGSWPRAAQCSSLPTRRARPPSSSGKSVAASLCHLGSPIALRRRSGASPRASTIWKRWEGAGACTSSRRLGGRRRWLDIAPCSPNSYSDGIGFSAAVSPSSSGS